MTAEHDAGFTASGTGLALPLGSAKTVQVQSLRYRAPEILLFGALMGFAQFLLTTLVAVFAYADKTDDFPSGHGY